ncbi:tetratricopeptide repeat protein [Leptonema illini]|uniref:Uncharacterized protein n=1 Tax=Leptonema illini DSM 21528 TaxID=929563 RepID=H2CGP1_9LEPT|nr:tetratricopeptide repeat protein [Leptonema illini]EHQ04717.1 hypothetical protein Lepil_0002 [Leptonema illini DSM 21528]
MKYLNIEAIDLTADDIDFLAGLQKGFPEQAIYTVDLLKDIGISSLKRESFRVIEFNQDRVSTLLKEFLESEMQFLSFMARFDFISIELLNEMISEENTYTSCINKWIAHSLCEQIGTNLEYIRVNDAIKDYILRLKIDVPPVLAEKLRSVAKDYLSRGDFSDRSEYIISLRELLTENPNLNDDRIIPSIYLKTMVDLYNNHKNRYNDVINLADRVLSREEFLDRRFAQEVRYRLCQSLARTRNGRFMEEVHKINGIEHHYLLGFHYRISGRNEDALNRLNKVLQSKPNHSRAKRELVHVYLNIEEYDQALDMASDNYRSEPSNPYLIQSYFTCLIRSQDSTAHREKIEELIQRLQRIRTSAAEEIYINSLAQYQAFTLGDKASAIKCIEDYQETTAEASPYIALTKIEIGIRYKDIGLMRQSLELLGTMNIQNSYLNNLYFLKLATLNAMEGNRPEAERNIQKIVNYPPNIRAKLMSKIESFLPKN